MPTTNEKRHIKRHETGKCKCRLDASVFDNKPRWNNAKCRCKCKELSDKAICDNGFTWNPINYDCACNKLCFVGEYLDCKNCKCRNKLVDKLVEELSEKIDGNEMIYNKTLNDYKKIFYSCTLYKALFAIAFLIIIDISSAFLYFCWYLKRK